MQASQITIGNLSEQTGVNIETVRYYERIALIPRPVRTRGGRRIYDAKDVQRLAFVRRARQLGFSIEEIRSLLQVAKGSGTCRDVHAMTIHHRDVVRANIRDLRRLERTLSAAADRCSQNASPKCAIIETLGQI